LRTAHIDVTFQPTFFAVPHRDFANQNVPGVLVRRPPGVVPARNVHNFIGESTERGSKRGWNQILSIEMTAPDTSFGLSGEADEKISGHSDVFSSRLCSLGSRDKFTPKKQVRFMPPIPERPPVPSFNRSDHPQPVQEIIDRGEVIDTGLLSALRDSAPAGAGSNSTSANISNDMQGVGSAAPQENSMPVFSISKPGIKSSKKPTGRGKGVIGAVLGADGSVTHEQSRML
jgi:hypothetical protein